MNREEYIKFMSYAGGMEKFAAVKPQEEKPLEKEAKKVGPYTDALMKKQAGYLDKLKQNWNNAMASWKGSAGKDFLGRIMTFIRQMFGGKGAYSYAAPKIPAAQPAVLVQSNPSLPGRSVPVAQKGVSQA